MALESRGLRSAVRCHARQSPPDRLKQIAAVRPIPFLHIATTVTGRSYFAEPWYDALMRRLGSWLVIATLWAAPGPKQVLPLGSSIALELAGDESETLLVDVPAERAARLTVHEERGIAGRF